jgi:hypothetical protein
MTDDRSERLRKRRKRATDRSASEEHESEEPDRTNGRSEGESQATTDSVKEEQTGTYMYLPKRQVKDLKRQYNVLKAEYEYEFDEEFEKNRHFYPLVIKNGLDSLEEMDARDLRDSLEEI